MKVQQNYSIGLDIGTNSVGYAVIGDDYKVLSYNRRKAWGVNLLDEAKTAEGRRAQRTARRRMVRRAERIRLLRRLTSNTVLTKDESFFLKLEKTSFLTLAKDTETGRPYDQKFNLFNDLDFTDKDYYRLYPTIYHLRNKLMFDKSQADPRLIYLAMHHIIKYRGNFLHEGENLKSGGNLKELLVNYFKAFDETMESREENQENINIYDENKIEKIIEILEDKLVFKKDKIKNIKALYEKDESNIIETHIKALLGRSVELGKLYNLEGIVEEDGKEVKFSFSSNEYEQKEGELIDMLGEFAELFASLKDLYGAYMFNEVTQGKKYISQAMVAKYETHKEHLGWLKKCLKGDKALKFEMFYKKPIKDKPKKDEDDEEGEKKEKQLYNYWAYINTPKKCPIAEFAKHVKKVLGNISDSAEKKHILDAIENEEFMPKQTSVANSYIPYQMNEDELKLILGNQKVYYKELEENYDKILSLLTFRRPYYVGVLKSEKSVSPYGWYDEKITEKVYPWNFKELVKCNDAQEKFINNLTNYCNIFSDETVLAKNSITYQTYATLNELNCLKFKNNNISHEVKMEIFNNLCKKTVTVSAKTIAVHLKKVFGMQYNAEDITGFADEAKLVANMSTFRTFKRVFGDNFDENKMAFYDKIAEYLTIFNESHSRAEVLSAKLYLDDKIINELKRLSFKGWGKYSAKVLRGTLNDAGKSIVDIMTEQERHFNNIIFDESLGFAKKFMIAEKTRLEKFNYNDNIATLYCSPKIKKSIWNAIKIVEEIERIMGCAPKHIFIETTETDEVKTRTKSRADKVKEAYLEIKEGSDAYEYLVEELKNEKDKALNLSDNNLDDKLYLWLMQMGRCMYSEDYMPIETLYRCEIDHIVPRCFIKDDSFDNRVLVKKIENQQKSDTLALSPAIRNKMGRFWKMLLDKKMISKKKYFNLIKDKYDESDSEKFINRQLVETNQIVRAVRELLLKKYPQDSVQGVRAGLSSAMRSKFMNQNKSGFFKNRLLNDLHHAKDAYLTAVLGQFVSEAYPMWGQDEDARKYKRQIFALSQQKDIAKGRINDLVNNRYGVIIDALSFDENSPEYKDMDVFEMDDDGEYKWNKSYFNNVLNQMSYNDINVVRQKVFKANTNFYDQQYKTKGKNLMPKKFVKNKDGIKVPMNPALYGGYGGTMDEYFCIVKCYSDSGKCSHFIVGIPVLDAYEIRANKFSLEDVILPKIKMKKLKFTPIRFEISKKYIHKYQLFSWHNFSENEQLFNFTSQSEIITATQLIVDSKYEKLLYNVSKFCDKTKEQNNARYKNEIIKILDDEPNLAKDFITHYIDKIKRFYPIYVKYIDGINDVKDNYFDNANIENKILYLEFLLKLTQAKSKRPTPPKLMGKKSEHGRLNNQIIDPTKIDFIDQSITGLYVKVTKGKDLC